MRRPLNRQNKTRIRWTKTTTPASAGHVRKEGKGSIGDDKIIGMKMRSCRNPGNSAQSKFNAKEYGKCARKIWHLDDSQRALSGRVPGCGSKTRQRVSWKWKWLSLEAQQLLVHWARRMRTFGRMTDSKMKTIKLLWLKQPVLESLYFYFSPITWLRMISFICPIRY